MNYSVIARWAGFVRDIASIWLAVYVLIDAPTSLVGIVGLIIVTTLAFELVLTFSLERAFRRARAASAGELDEL